MSLSLLRREAPKRANGSAEVVEIEIDGKGIALRGRHVDGGGAARKVFDGEIKLQRGAGERAAAVLRADEIRLAVGREGAQFLVFAGDLNVEVFPEVIRAGDEAGGGTGTGTRGANDVSAVRIGELDLHNDSYKFGLIAMIECRLLGAVTRSVLAGLLDEKSERSEEGDGGDVRTGFRRRKESGVFVEESGHGAVMALAEEVGFADGLVGEGRVEGDGWLAEQQSRDCY